MHPFVILVGVKLRLKLLAIALTLLSLTVSVGVLAQEAGVNGDILDNANFVEFYTFKTVYEAGEIISFHLPGSEGLLQIINPVDQSTEFVLEGDGFDYELNEQIVLGQYQAHFYTPSKTFSTNFEVVEIEVEIEVSPEDEEIEPIEETVEETEEVEEVIVPLETKTGAYVDKEMYFPGEKIIFTLPEANGLLQITKPSGSTEEILVEDLIFEYGNDEKIELGDYSASYYTSDKTWSITYSVSMPSSEISIETNKKTYAVGEIIAVKVYPFVGIEEMVGALVDPVGNELPFVLYPTSANDAYEAFLNISSSIILDSSYTLKVIYGSSIPETTFDISLYAEEMLETEKTEIEYKKDEKLIDRVKRAFADAESMEAINMKLDADGNVDVTGMMGPLKISKFDYGNTQITPLINLLDQNLEIEIPKQRGTRKVLLFDEDGPMDEVHENDVLSLEANGNYYFYGIKDIPVLNGNDEIADMANGRRGMKIRGSQPLKWNAWDIDIENGNPVISTDGPRYSISRNGILADDGETWIRNSYYLDVDGTRISLLDLPSVQYPESEGVYERYVYESNYQDNETSINSKFEFFEHGKMKFSVYVSSVYERNYSLIIGTESNQDVDYPNSDYIDKIRIGKYNLGLDDALYEGDIYETRRALSSQLVNGELVIRYPSSLSLYIDPILSEPDLQDEFASSNANFCFDSTASTNHLLIGNYSTTFPDYTSYIWFNLTNLPQNISILSANLSLYCNYSYANVDVEVFHMEDRDDSQTTCTIGSPSDVGASNDYGSYHDHETCTGTNPYSSTINTAAFQWYNVTIDTNHVEWENNNTGAGGGGSNDYILFKLNCSNCGGTSRQYVRCDSAEASNDPVLYIEYVDERANLTIWDDDDAGNPYVTGSKIEDEKVMFYANYTDYNGTILNSTPNSYRYPDWYYYKFSYRKQVNFSQTTDYNVSRTNEHVRFNITLTEGKENNASGMAFVCDGTQHPMDAYVINTSNGWDTGIMVLGEMDLTYFENKSCYVYYDPVYDGTEMLPTADGWRLVESAKNTGSSCTQAEANLDEGDICSGGYSTYSNLWWASVPNMCGDGTRYMFNSFCYFKSPVNGTQTFGDHNDDSAFLYIDGTTIVNDPGCAESTTTGTHPLNQSRYYDLTQHWSVRWGPEKNHVFFNDTTWDGSNANDMSNYCYGYYGDEWELSLSKQGDEDVNINVCEFMINDSGGWQTYPMMYNGTKKLYEANYSFPISGKYNWNVSCDYDVYETEKANDTIAIALKPDFAISEAYVNMTTDSFSGVRHYINISVINSGDVDGSGTINVTIYFDGVYANSTNITTGLNVGERKRVNLSWIPTGIGTHYLNISVDPSNITAEKLESNNNITIGFSVVASSKGAIWDETDTPLPYATGKKYQEQDVKFFANYTNSSDFPLNMTFNYKMQVNLSQAGGYNLTRTDEHVLLNISLSPGRERNASGMEFICDGTQYPLDAYEVTTSGEWVTEAMLLVELDFTYNENKTCYVYYDPVYDGTELLPTADGWRLVEDEFDVSGSCTETETNVTSPCSGGYESYTSIWWANVPDMCGTDEDYVFNSFCYFKAPETNTETFGTRSDDGSWLYKDNTLIVDNAGCHGSETATGTSSTTADRFYAIDVYWNENTGGDVMYAWFNDTDYDQSNVDDFSDYCYGFYGDEWEIAVDTGTEETTQGCHININVSGGWTGWEFMTYNSTKKLYEYNRSFALAGDYPWNVSCSKPNYSTQDLNNSVHITGVPNLITNANNISLNTSLIRPWETVLINITVLNDGLEHASNINVTVWINASYLNSSYIRVGIGSQNYSYFNWTPTEQGEYVINVSIDPLNTINESSENDNNATLNVNVSYETLLEIWDANDAKGGSMAISPLGKANFYANYTNASGYPINTTLVPDAHCNISTYNGSEWMHRPMFFNATNSLYQFNRTYVSGGTFQWNVSCEAIHYDAKNSSGLIFIGNSPEFRIGAVDISWTPSVVYSGTRPIINATVHNDGTQKGVLVNVSFYTNDTFINSTTINISAVSSNKTSFFWHATTGHKLIKIAVDVLNKISETDYSNNNASKVMTVSTATNLSIWDEGDKGEKYHTRELLYIYDQVHFYANYSNTSGGYANESNWWPDWWNGSMEYRVSLNLTQPGGYNVTRVDEAVRIYVNFTEGKEDDIDSMAFVCNNTQYPMEAYEIASSGGWVTQAMLVAQLNFSYNENKTCHVYYDPVNTAPSKPLTANGWNLVEEATSVSSCGFSESNVDTPCSGGYENYTTIWFPDHVPVMCGAADDFIFNAFCYFKAPETNTETFGTRSDDGSFLYKDDVQVVDNGGCQSTNAETGTSSTTADQFYDISFYWNENGGNAVAYAWFNDSDFDDTYANDFRDYCHRYYGDEWEIDVDRGEEYRRRGCEVQINMSGGWRKEAMVFNKTKNIHEYNMSFSLPGTYKWNVTCSAIDYENQTRNDTIKIIKIVDVRGTKRVTKTTDAYLVELHVSNEAPHITGPVILYEYVPSNFTASSFTKAPSDSDTVVGKYNGTVYKIVVGRMNVSESKEYYYNLTASGLYSVSLTQMMGLDPILEIQENYVHQEREDTSQASHLPEEKPLPLTTKTEYTSERESHLPISLPYTHYGGY
jgi:hypothetical protein